MNKGLEKVKAPFLYQSMIFDLDGTLVDSRDDIRNCLSMAYSMNGFEPQNELDSLKIGPPVVEMIRTLSPDLNNEQREIILTSFRQIYDNFDYKDTYCYEGVRPLINRLSAKGISMFVATNKPMLPTKRIIGRLFGSTSMFKDIVTIDAIEGRKLSKIEMILTLMTRWDLEKWNTIMVGDTAGDISAAHCNGIHSIGVLNGYGDLNEIVHAGPTIILNGVHEITTMI